MFTMSTFLVNLKLTYLDDSFDVTTTFGVVQRAEHSRSLSVFVVGFEDASSALTLTTDNAPHDCRSLCVKTAIKRHEHFTGEQTI